MGRFTGRNIIATGTAANDAMISIIVIYYFALSFLGVYLITRLYLTSAFQQTLGNVSGRRQSAPDPAINPQPKSEVDTGSMKTGGAAPDVETSKVVT